jgi:hypothetical protein
MIKKLNGAAKTKPLLSGPPDWKAGPIAANIEPKTRQFPLKKRGFARPKA